MKPFNLELALQGHPVVTRGGKEISQLTLFVCKHTHPLVGVIDGERCVWTRNGNGRYNMTTQSNSDLFLKDCDWQPEPKFGDLVEVSDSGINWTERIFICKTPDGRILAASPVENFINRHKPLLSFGVTPWNHMRPIQKELNIKITVSINDKPAKLSDISDETLRKIKEAE